MALPADATKVHMDETTDDPEQARAELADLVDKFNDLLSVLGNHVELAIANGLENDGASGLAVSLATDSGFEFATGKVRVKAIEGLQRKTSDAGLSLDVNGLTEEPAIDGGVDYVPFYDTSAGVHRKIKQNDLSGLATGSVAQYIASTPPATWLMMEGGTIGSATSGASVRANADTEALFLLLWDNSTDTELPVSTGRGGSAAADWALNKNITLPDARGRTLIGTGTGSGLTARTNMETDGEEDHQLTEPELAAHAHGVEGIAISPLGSTGGHEVGAGTGTQSEIVGSDTPHNTMQPFLAIHFIIKL